MPKRNPLAGFFKIPSTRGGRIRLLGLLATSITSVAYPPASAYINAALKALLQNVSGQ